MANIALTHLGGPTTLIEIDGWRILTDPTFDAPGRRYTFGWGTSSVKVAGPAQPPEVVAPVDVVLLSHDQHADNLDDAGRALLAQAGTVITTVPAARRLALAERPRPGGLGVDDAGSAGPRTADRHRHPGPARAEVQPADRGQGQRFCAAPPGRGHRRAVDVGGHRALRRPARGRAADTGRRRPAAPGRGSVRIHRAGALHDDRA